MNAGGPSRGIYQPSTRSMLQDRPGFSVLARVGSWHPYCSKDMLHGRHKQGSFTKEHDASVETIIYYNDLRRMGGILDFHRKAKEQGTSSSGPGPNVFESPETKESIVRSEIWRQGMKKEEVNFWSFHRLCRARKQRSAKVPRSPRQARIFQEKDPFMAPLETECARDYLCGGDRADRHSESVRSGTAASMKAVLRKRQG